MKAYILEYIIKMLYLHKKGKQGFKLHTSHVVDPLLMELDMLLIWHLMWEVVVLMKGHFSTIVWEPYPMTYGPPRTK